MRLRLSLVLLLTPACSRPADPPPAKLSAPVAAPAPAAAPARYGAPLSAAAAVPIAAVIGAARDHSGKTLKVQGQVSSLCVKKGCWLTLVPAGAAAEAPAVRVTFKDYGFFVPKELLGKQVLAEGVFEVKVTPQAEAQHFAEDAVEAGQPARKVTGDEQTLALVASGVEVVP